MSLTLYCAPMSTATITELVVEELGVPCEKVKVDLQRKETKKPDYLKLDPNGRVPLIVHDGMPIWESAAITMYLGEQFGVEKKLYPAAGPKRGEAMKWITWANVTLGEAVSRWSRNTSDRVPAEQRNAKAGEVARQDVDHCLRILDQALESRQFLCGEYTLADTHLNSLVDWLRYLQIDLAPFGRLSAWSARCCARPAYGRVMTQGA